MGGIHPGWGTTAIRVVIGLILTRWLGLLLFLNGPGKAAIDEVWLERHA